MLSQVDNSAVIAPYNEHELNYEDQTDAQLVKALSGRARSRLGNTDYSVQCFDLFNSAPIRI